jgi:radical SAM superfamily enzyme YgiQ (UPF0313 family)
MRIGLVQINNSFSGQTYLPYSVGVLQAFIERHASADDRPEFLLPVFSRVRVPDAVEHLLDADVVFFSMYAWNQEISFRIAAGLKRVRPATAVVFGGPQVPDHAEEFLRGHRFIDIAVHGEGEQTALAIARAGGGCGWQAADGVSWLDEAGAFHTRAKGPRLKDLSVVPSPYVAGTFRPLMEAYPDQRWIALWETNRGCPFSCTFCDWGSSVAAKLHQFPMEQIRAEVEWFAEHRIEFIFCCDANFGILPRDLEIVAHVAETRRRTGFPQALSVQNTKNATERAYEVQKALSDAGLNKGVALSMQSLDPTTLISIKRANISSGSYRELQRRFTRDRVETFSDLILGLPGETYASFTAGVRQLVEDGQHNRIQFNNLSILPNAEMGAPAYQREHGLVLVDTVIINIHGSLQDADNEILERQQLVVGTRAMPLEDWRRTRAFCWMAALLYFNKVFQIPLVIAMREGGLRFDALVEAFLSRAHDGRPVLAGIRASFEQAAADIQNGGAEYIHSPQFLDIFWPADELALIRLVADGHVETFYREALDVLVECLGEGQRALRPALEDAVRLNQALLKLPFQDADVFVDLEHNVWDCYRGALTGLDVPLEPRARRHRVDRSSVAWRTWDDYCRDVIWYGNKKGAYLYGNTAVESEIAGIY